MILIGLNKATVPLVNNITSVVQNVGILTGDCFRRVNLLASQNKRIGLKQSENKKHDIYLSAEIIRKMVLRFLGGIQMPEKKLAKILRINVRNLRQLCSLEVTQALIAKVNLPMIKFYCKTYFKSNT